MKKAGFSPKTKKLLAFIAIVLVVGMFLVRGILLNNGTINEMLTATPEELEARITSVQFEIASGSQQGIGTAIDSFKESTKDETFGTYLIAANHVIVDPSDITATAKNGTTYAATLIATDVDRDLAILEIQTENETEALYDRDAIGRLKTDDTVYYMTTDGELVATTLTGKGVTVTGLEITSQYGEEVANTEQLSDMNTVSGSFEDGMAGGGVYDISGYYVGMIIQDSDENTLAVIPGNEVHDAVKAAD